MFEGHSDSIYSIVFSHDGSRLVSSSSHEIRIWDLGMSQTQCVLNVDEYFSTSTALSHDNSRLAVLSQDGDILMIRDTTTGRCVQALAVGMQLREVISFNTTGLLLHTEIGDILLDQREDISPTAFDDPYSTFDKNDAQDPRYEGYSISSDTTWIRWNSEKVLWLPPEYRPACSAVNASNSKSLLAVGCPSGRVLIFQFSIENTLEV